MRKVEIIGAGWAYGSIPPFDLAPDVERWGTNNVMWARPSEQYEPWTRWFDLHPTSHIQTRRPQAYEWYRQQIRPIYRWDVDPDVPASVAYPKDAVLDFFSADGHRERDFWGSLSWMLALAIMEGFQQIDLFWFSLMNDHYTKQVPSTRYWIGQARGRGVRVDIHGDSMLKPFDQLYGCEALADPLTV